MKHPYSPISNSIPTIVAETPYHLARQEWDHRIGDARVQAKNWRWVALISLILTFGSIFTNIFMLIKNKDHLFIAEISQAGRVINVSPLQIPYEPQSAQIQYFLKQTLKNIREISLDPVLTKKNWMSAYPFFILQAQKKLNQIMQQQNPLSKFGKQTTVIEIMDSIPLSQNTYQLNWRETTLDIHGQHEHSEAFGGIFTITIIPPKHASDFLENPLGLYIADFNLTTKEI